MLVKVIAVQARMGQELPLEQKIHIFKHRPDFVCLPEYWRLDSESGDYHRAALSFADHLNYLARLSDELSTCLIGGTVVEPSHDRLLNTCIVFDRGREIGRYRKRRPVPGEASRGISAGDRTLVFDLDGVRAAIMVCGDVFYPELYDELAREGVDLIFIPTTSPLRVSDTISMKQERDRRYFTAGALQVGAYVCKVCGVGAIFGKPLQGRSLITAPWGMIARVDYRREAEEQLLAAVLDIGEVREFRRKLRLIAPEQDINLHP